MGKVEELRAKFHKAVRDGNIQAAEALAKELNSEPSNETVYICNLTEKTWGPVNLWHYMAPVVIPGKKPGEAYSITPITPHTDHIDLGEGKTLPVFIPAREAADDICHVLNSDIGETSYSGVFVIEAGEVPTEHELTNARDRLEDFYKRLVSVADQEWDRGLKANISDLHRSAGRYFKLSKPWLPDMRLRKECPVCGESIPSSVATCKGCGAILDSDLARRYGVVDRDKGWTSAHRPTESKTPAEMTAAAASQETTRKRAL